MHSEITLSHPTKKLFGSIKLPASKSLSNRALILNALMQNASTLINISDANDTTILTKALYSSEKKINIGDAGTAARFLTAFFAATQQEKIITGNERMLERPIGKLVDALIELGAKINYLGKIGFFPLHIRKNNIGLIGGELTISGDISSQYISALLMIAPILEKGLRLIIENKITSKPYILMTLRMLEQVGIKVNFENNIISIAKQTFITNLFNIEADWSAASYWYSMVGLAEEAEIELIGLTENSLQGDIAIAELMGNSGVETHFTTRGILLKKNKKITQLPSFIDFSDIPDLAQTLLVFYAAKNYPLEFYGVETLEIKETKRITALKQEFEKFNVVLKPINNKHFGLSGNFSPRNISISTYNDHRMAMGFAPLALVCKKIKIQNPEAVKKSYPNFWKDLLDMGFKANNT